MDPLSPEQAGRLKEVAEELREVDRFLDLTCSVSTGLRLRPETGTPLGLNPFHLALTDATFASLAVQGHVRRAAGGDRSPELQQDLASDLRNLSRFHRNMGYWWNIYELNAGPAIAPVTLKMRHWHLEMSKGLRRAGGKAREIIGPERWEALEATVPAMVGMIPY